MFDHYHAAQKNDETKLTGQFRLTFVPLSVPLSDGKSCQRGERGTNHKNFRFLAAPVGLKVLDRGGEMPETARNGYESGVRVGQNVCVSGGYSDSLSRTELI